jgi:hypothetical protein
VLFCLVSFCSGGYNFFESCSAYCCSAECHSDWLCSTGHHFSKPHSAYSFSDECHSAEFCSALCHSNWHCTVGYLFPESCSAYCYYAKYNSVRGHSVFYILLDVIRHTVILESVVLQCVSFGRVLFLSFRHSKNDTTLSKTAHRRR